MMARLHCLVCVGCGASMTSIQSDRKYCSALCYSRHGRKKYTFRCRGCGALVSKRTASKKTKFCSRGCHGKHSTKQASAEYACEWCDNKFTKLRSAKRRNNKHRFCSIKCYGYSKRYQSQNKIQVGGNGYAIEYYDDRRMARGRCVMARLLGRALFSHEEVHHKNGDKLDDSLENLELWSTSHPKGQRVVDKVNWAQFFLRQHGYHVIKEADIRDRQIC